MKKRVKNLIFNRFFAEYKVNSVQKLSDITEQELKVIHEVKDFTLTNPERIVSLLRAIDYVHKFSLEGSIVECGVWKGGSIMASLIALNNKKDFSRDVYLYDTFEGMSEPTKNDKSFKNESAIEAYNNQDSYWDRIKCFSTLEEVKKNVLKIKYPAEKIHFIEGKVEDTIPSFVPDKISILRLDTDWYESTKHELNYLYPRLVNGGVLIIDDYGHWKGCKKAVDEYFEKNNVQILLNRIDYTCRIGIKME